MDERMTPYRAFSGFAVVIATFLCACGEAQQPAARTPERPTTAAAAPPPEPQAPPPAQAAAAAPLTDSTIYFEFDSSEVDSRGRETLGTMAGGLREAPSVRLRIEGHCDERGTTEYNLALGERRANATRDYLRNLGADAGRMTTQSYGEERPADPGHDESAWSHNRRAEIKVLR